jgi:hypothetical protein
MALKSDVQSALTSHVPPLERPEQAAQSTVGGNEGGDGRDGCVGRPGGCNPDNFTEWRDTSVTSGETGYTTSTPVTDEVVE